MSKIVEMINDEPRVSHTLVAESTANKLQSIQDMITRNISDFKEFGDLEIEEKKVRNSVGAVNIQKTYFLNEQQATLLMTYLKNSEVVKGFKKALVREFYKMRQSMSTAPISDIGALVGMFQQSMVLQQQHNEMMMMSMNTMMEMMGQLTTMVGSIIETQSKTVKENLTRDQLDQIKLAVNRAAKPLADAHNFTWGEAVRYVYTELNGRMGVFSYYHISPSDFDEAIKLLERMREVKQYQADTGEMMLMNIEINLGGSK